MKLGERQELFMQLLPRLIDHAHEQGYRLRGGDLFRDPRLHGHFGKPNVISFMQKIFSLFYMRKIQETEYKGYGSEVSNHKLKCAIDLNLFKDGDWLSSTEDHRELGKYWESLHPNCRWGGRFNDGNHYELLGEERDES